jgi:hypothetical protein
VDLLLFTRHHVDRGDVAYGTVKATIVAILSDSVINMVGPVHTSAR